MTEPSGILNSGFRLTEGSSLWMLALFWRAWFW
ncbi:hypothetical protein Pecwa_2585 [Pectobacterium parmentieri WPP163]|nr:hypothetical protein Pecwa_2585 [Pectobacterium parmentieri WPP163]